MIVEGLSWAVVHQLILLLLLFLLNMDLLSGLELIHKNSEKWMQIFELAIQLMGLLIIAYSYITVLIGS